MKIKTRDFGEMEIRQEDIVRFSGEIFGFGDYRKFVFLYQEDISEHFVWMQSTEEPDLCFILVSPEVVADSFSPKLPDNIETLIGPGDCMCWLMVVVKEPFVDSTVNLRSPIVVNPETKKAAQIILEADYPVKHPLIPKKEGA